MKTVQETSMKRTTLLFILVAVAGVLVGGSAFRNSNAGIVRTVQAHEEEEGCTLATLQGTYLFTVRLDNRSDLPDPKLPGVVAGVRTFDGAGNLSQVASDSMGGVITQRIAATGTYTLDSDCIGTMTIRGRPWDIFVAEDGSEGVGTRTDPGTIAAQTFKKRSRNDSR
jgi:hypothetical protein